MAEIKITFESLYEVLRRERSREELQEVDENFLDNVRGYCDEKQSFYEDSTRKNDLFSIGEQEKIHLQLSNIRRVLRELYDRRERKVLLLAMNKARTGVRPVDASFLMPHEKVFFDETVRVLVDSRERSLYPLLNSVLSSGASSQKISEPVKSDLSKVKFIRPTDAFVGKNLEVFGPFSTGDETVVSKDVAELLVEKGNALIV